MIITLKQLISLLPLLILGLTAVVLMLFIAWRRDHFISAILTAVGLNLALLSLFFVASNGPLDITLLMRIDGFSILYTALVLIASLATTALAYTWLAGYKGNCDEFYLLVLVAAIGGVQLSCANHFAMLFLGIELISLPLFGMIGYAFHENRSLEASIKYTFLSSAAFSFLLFGIALIYAETGKLSFIQIGQTLHNGALKEPPLLLLGLGMMIVGLGFKLSWVPFHLWTPDVYQGSPAPVSAFLATTSKIAIFAVVMRLFLYVPLTHNEIVRTMLSLIAIASILFGNLMALRQGNLKRLLGYSSIAHLGYLLVGLIEVQAKTFSIEAVGIYLVGYLFTSLGSFGVVSIMSSPPYIGEDSDSLYSYRGLFWHKPLLSLALTAMMLSLAGAPMTLGFIGKLYIIALGVDSHLVCVTTSLILGSAIGLFYYLRVIISLYLSPPKNLRRNIVPNRTLNAGSLVVLICLLLVLFFGAYPQPLITLVKLAKPT